MESTASITVSSRLDQHPLRVVVHGTAELRELMRGHVLISDLSRGGWQANRLANDLCAQMKTELCTVPVPTFVARRGRFSFAQAAARGIDAESAGDHSLDRGAELGAALVKLSRTQCPIQVLMLRSIDVPVSDENRRIWSGLVNSLQYSDIEVLEVFVEVDSEVENPWHGYLVPGVLGPELLEPLHASREVADALLELPHGYRLQPLEWSAFASHASRFDFDRLASISELPHWIRVYAQVHGNHHFVDPELLIEQAWAEFEAGGKQLALVLLDRCLEVCRDAVERGTVMCHIQGMRIADLRFAEVAAVESPLPSLPVPIRAFLLMAKGWGYVLKGCAAEGEEFLRQAQTVGAYQTDSAEQLYLDNIRALARFRQGDIGSAFALERRIATVLSSGTEYDAQIEYVNALNLARLYTVTGEHQSAYREYRRAFATASGALVEADLLYSCVCFARCAEAIADTDLARLEWLKAALYWLSNPNQHSISRRIAAIISNSPWTDAMLASHAISQTIMEALERVWDVEPAATGVKIVRIRTAKDLPSDLTMVGAGGLYLMPMLGDAAESEDIANALLARVVAAALMQCFNNCSERFGSMIGLPIRDGFGMPQNELDAYTECVRLGIRHAWILGRRIDVSLTAEDSLKIRLNPNVHILDGDRYLLVARFRRYGSPRQLLGINAEIVDAARNPVPLPRLAEFVGMSSHELLFRLRTLEADGLIDIYMSEAL